MWKTFALLACLATPAFAEGGDPPAHTAPAFTAARGAFLALSVADIEASVAWYRDKLGLDVVQRPPKFQTGTVVILEGGGLIVELLQLDDGVPLRVAAPSIAQAHRIHGVFKAGLIVDDLDRTIEVLRARGVEIAMGPFPARDGQRANAIVKDNAGNLIQFFGK